MRFVTKGQRLTESGGSARLYCGILAIIFGVVVMVGVTDGVAFGVILILLGVILIASKVISSSHTKTIIAPDAYAQAHISRCAAGMKDDAALQKRWNTEIASLLIQANVDDNVMLWVAQHIFFSVSLPSELTGKVRDTNYHVSHSRYAILDFCLFSFFDVRKMLIQCADRRTIRKVEKTYFDFLVKYFHRYFGMTEEEINRFIDIRLEKYEGIMRLSDKVDIDKESLTALAGFIVSDFNNTPFSYEICVAAADKTSALCLEISSLMSAQYELLKKHPPEFLS